VTLAVRTAGAVAADDRCRIGRPENTRGFILTERYAL
jgi:hypothetical protein